MPDSDQAVPDNPVVAFVAFGRPEAVVIQSKLADAGIGSFLRYESLTHMYPVSVDGLGRIEIVIAAEDESRAREVIGSGS